MEASSDEKLRKAFENIEQLSKELGEATAKLRQQVHSSSHVLCIRFFSDVIAVDGFSSSQQEDELQEARDAGGHEEAIERLERKLTEANDEISKLEAQVAERAQWNEKLTRDCKT